MDTPLVLALGHNLKHTYICTHTQQQMSTVYACKHTDVYTLNLSRSLCLVLSLYPSPSLSLSISISLSLSLSLSISIPLPLWLSVYVSPSSLWSAGEINETFCSNGSSPALRQNLVAWQQARSKLNPPHPTPPFRAWIQSLRLMVGVTWV